MNQSEKALANTILTKNQVWRSEEDLKLAEKQLVRSKTIKVLDELLAFTDDIQKSYIDADNELKRRYLQIFFEKIIVNDGQIVDVIYTPAISQLLEIDRVRITNNWRKGRDSNPRPACAGTAFRERYFRPLRHPSIDKVYFTRLARNYHYKIT